jgi:hypothetical protein
MMMVFAPARCDSTTTGKCKTRSSASQSIRRFSFPIEGVVDMIHHPLLLVSRAGVCGWMGGRTNAQAHRNPSVVSHFQSKESLI